MKKILTKAVLSLCLAATASAESGKPNVIVIYADDLGYGDLGCYGATKINTPNIDKLAEGGKRFTDAHSASAVCTPSRYALITGEYPLRAHGGEGAWGPTPLTSPLIIDTEKFTIADVFKKKGYATACIGKWHLGFGEEEGGKKWDQPLSPGPNDLGFDYYFGMPVVNSSPPYLYVENDTIVGYDSEDPIVYIGKEKSKGKGADQPEVYPLPKIPKAAGQRSGNQFAGAKKAHSLFVEDEVGPTLAKKAVEWIDNNKDDSFFLYLATTHIHHPFTPSARFKGTSEIGLYGDFIHELDWMVGEVVAALEKNGLSENTLIVFTSDNGGMFNQGGQDAWKAGHAQNGELLGHKFGVWEGGHRVPFIANWPGKIKPNTESDQLVSSIDFLATFSSIIGLELTEEEQGDSINVSSTFLEDPKEPVRDYLILAPRRESHLSIRKGKWMYIPTKGGGGWNRDSGHTFSGPPAITHMSRVNSDIENGKIKKEASPAQLYNLETDLKQTQNVYLENPEVVKAMKAILNTYKNK